MKKLFLIFFILLITSCKLFEAQDTTNPIVNLTIEGGNEISREVTLYLDIEDDSDIDSVQVIIDDSVYTSVSSNFDTIRFIVNRIEDFSINEPTALLKKPSSSNKIDFEQKLYAKAHDAEGNIGESEIVDIVITDFPGWRKYYDLDSYVWSFLVDDNGLIWIGLGGQLNIYNPINNQIRILTQDNSDLPNYTIDDIAVVEGSRVWITTTYSLIEYIYDTNKIIKSVDAPIIEGDYGDYQAEFWSIAIDKHFNLWIGGRYQLFYYDHAEIKEILETGFFRTYDVLIFDENVLFVTDDYGVHKVTNETVSIITHSGYGSSTFLDSDRNVWMKGFGGALMYNGVSLEKIEIPNLTPHVVNPALITKNDILYCEVFINSSDSYGLATYDGTNWKIWDSFDSPFIDSVNWGHYIYGAPIDEAPNGDIWMVLDNTLWRYRPSLGEYP